MKMKMNNEKEFGCWVQELEYYILDKLFSEKTEFNLRSGTNGLADFVFVSPFLHVSLYSTIVHLLETSHQYE